MIRLNWRRGLVVLGLSIVLALGIVGRRLNATKVGGQAPAEPFRHRRQLLLRRRERRLRLLIPGRPHRARRRLSTTAKMIMGIAKLGFDIRTPKCS